MKTTTLLLALLFAGSTMAAMNKPANSDGSIINHSKYCYDSLLVAWYGQNINMSADQFYEAFIEVDPLASQLGNTPDSVYASRLKSMFGPIQLPYNNIVRSYLVVYTEKRQTTMAKVIGLSQYYFPMIEAALIKHGLPVELRMLPVIESALNPLAVSRVGATGLWQFMYFTGKEYGLEVSSFVDQRCDPELATEAACLFLKRLYSIYGDWTLAISAYNCGPGNVNKAIRRAGPAAKTFWDIYEFLPRETRGYFPAFVAASYTYTYHRQHGIEPIAPPIPIATDTVHVNQIMHLGQVASTLNIPMETLKALNPQYKLDILPSVDKKSYPLRLPVESIAGYIDLQEVIMGKDSVYMKEYFKSGKDVNAIVKAQQAKSTTIIYHKVRSGENLSLIANKYRVTVKQIMTWNRLSSSKIRAGQTLRIERR